MLTIILDNGHGKNTPGKCSDVIDFPFDQEFTSIENGKFREYRFNRRIVEAVIPKLKELGYNVIKLVPEETDISLTARVNRINQYVKKYGVGNCIMISVHANAAGHGGWLNARGWSVWTTKGQNNSDKLANCLYEAAKENISNDKMYTAPKSIRTDYSDGDADWESNFTIIKGANCPAVLIENMFQDNKEDVKYLESRNGFNRIVDTIIDGVKLYSEKYNKK